MAGAFSAQRARDEIAGGRKRSRERRPSLVLVIAVATAACLIYGGSPARGQSESGPKVVFAQDVLPILEASCHSCHGPEEQMGRLRLDSKRLALDGGQSGSVILPGDPSASELYLRVAGTSDQARMPMGGELPPAQIDIIRRWIQQGAEWPEGRDAEGAEIRRHWAFVAPLRPPLPGTKDTTWLRNAIDHFVLARLEEEGLSPSDEADRVTLLRRLSLDLIGLPPTINQVDAFLADPSPHAYETQVERLLASPHYGERWGRHWLDAARYADSDGFEKDKPRQVWFYRDWVVNALNRDLPYDRFVVEQLAGDLLPNATQDQRVATGFLRNSMINEEGGIDPEQFRMEAMFDRMDSVGKSILGVTIQCAQCHNHKYDPLTQEEYYRMFAFLNSSHEGSVAVYRPDEHMQRAAIFREIGEIEDELRHRNPDWRERMAAWEAEVSNDQPEWIVVRPTVEEISAGGTRYLPLEDGSLLAQGYASAKHRVQMAVETDLQEITAFRLELLTDPNLPFGGPGRSIKGTGALTEFEVEAAPADDPDSLTPVRISSTTADIILSERELDPIFHDKTDTHRVTGPIGFAIDGKEETAWGIDAGPGRRNRARKAVFLLESPISHDGGTILTFYLSQRHGGWNNTDNQSHNLGRIRLSVTTAMSAVADPLPQLVREILAVPQGQRTIAQTQTVFRYWRTTVADWRQANAKIDELWARHPEPTSQLVLQERQDSRATNVLERGDFLQLKQEVAPGVPSFLHPLPEDAPPTRLTFAEWLVDERSPTTARAVVNRIWQSYFGRGIVSTSENLGTQAEPPSHQALLDWLAVEFMERGWSRKQMHRTIVTSATYRQSSRVTSELYERDPYNRLLARGPRVRVEAEVVRDIALAASGLLDPTLGGPSVYPPAPEFLFVPPVSFGTKAWNAENGTDRYRRALYTFRYRSVPYPVLQVFDAPNGETSHVRRERSNTPLQALTTLNESLFVECARALALKTLVEAGNSDQERLVYAFRRALSRKPVEAESSELLSLLENQKLRLFAGWLDVWGLAGLDEAQTSALPTGTTPVELAAWTAVSRVLLNLDETITKQ